MSWSDVRFFTFLFVCIFLFDGTPDVWDKLHEKVMGMEVCK